MSEEGVHAASTIIVLVAAAIPIYLTIRLKSTLRILAAIFSVFMGLHAIYHLLGTNELFWLGEGVFEPLSVAALIIFGLFYMKISRQRVANAT